MTSKGLEGIKTANNIKNLDDKSEDDAYISYDAPPLDFSFKNIKHLAGTTPFTQNLKIYSLDREKRPLLHPKILKTNPRRKRRRKESMAPMANKAIIREIGRKIKSSNLSLRITSIL